MKSGRQIMHIGQCPVHRDESWILAFMLLIFEIFTHFLLLFAYKYQRYWLYRTIDLFLYKMDLTCTYGVDRENIKLNEKVLVVHSAQVAVSYLGCYYSFFARMLISRIVHC
jgi:hypothetical protein